MIGKSGRSGLSAVDQSILGQPPRLGFAPQTQPTVGRNVADLSPLQRKGLSDEILNERNQSFRSPHPGLLPEGEGALHANSTALIIGRRQVTMRIAASGKEV